MDISLTKDLSLLLHVIHSLSTGGFINKARLCFGFKNTYKKNRKTGKLEPIREYHFVERKNEGRKPYKLESEKTRGLYLKCRSRIPSRETLLQIS